MPKRIGLTVGPLLAQAISRYRLRTPSVLWRRFFPAVHPVRRADKVTPPPRQPPPLPSHQTGVSKGSTDTRPQTKTTAPNPDIDRAFEALSQLFSITQTHKRLKWAVARIPAVQQCLQTVTSLRLLVEQVSKRLPHHTPLLLRVAHRVEAPLRKNVFECALHLLFRQKHWNIMLQVVAIAKEQDLLTVRTLNWYTAAVANLHNYTKLHGVIEEFDAARLAPTRRTYHLLLMAYITNKDLRRAKQIMGVMQSNGIPVEPSTQAAIALSYRNLGRNVQVEKHTTSVLEDLPPHVATAVLNSMLRLQLWTNDLESAKRLLYHYRYANISPIIPFFWDHQYPDEYRHRLATGVDADAGTYALIIHWAARAGNLDLALQLFNEMQGVGLPPTVEVASALMHAYFSAGLPETAISLVFNMCQIADRDLFGDLLPHGAQAISLDTRGMKPSVRVFNSLLRGLLSSHSIHADRALDVATRVLRIMHANQVQPDVQTLSILTRHLIRVERTPPAALYRTLYRFSKGMPASTRPLHAIFSDTIRHERFLLYGSGWDTYAAQFSETRLPTERPPPHPDQLTGTSSEFDPLASLTPPVLKSEMGARWMHNIITTLSSTGVRSDAALFALRLQRDSMRMDFVASQEIFDTLLRRGLQPNAYHYSALMEGFTRSGDMEAAEALLAKAKLAGVTPNIVMYTVVVVGYARQGNHTEAIKVFEQIVAVGLTPDIASIDAVVSSLFVAGHYKWARSLLLQLWSYVAPLPDHLVEASLSSLVHHFRLLKGTRYQGKGLPKAERQILYKKLHNLLDAKDGR